MSNVASPYGLQPIIKTGSQVDNCAYTTYPMTANYASVIGMGDPVALVGASITGVAASPTTTFSANTPIGVFMGVSYQDPALGFVNRAFLPANAVNNGLTNIMIKVADDPSYIFKVQATGPVAANKLGAGVALKTSSLNSASIVNGSSAVSVDSTTVAFSGSSTLAFKIIGFATNPSSIPGDNFTDLLVRWNAGVHAYNQAGTQ